MKRTYQSAVVLTLSNFSKLQKATFGQVYASIIDATTQNGGYVGRFGKSFGEYFCHTEVKIGARDVFARQLMKEPSDDNGNYYKENIAWQDAILNNESNIKFIQITDTKYNDVFEFVIQPNSDGSFSFIDARLNNVKLFTSGIYEKTQKLIDLMQEMSKCKLD